jgi:hypothetical protein
VIINARCSLRIEADQRVIVVAGLPVHHYRAYSAAVFFASSGKPPHSKRRRRMPIFEA